MPRPKLVIVGDPRSQVATGTGSGGATGSGDLVTLVGLLVESAAGLRRRLAPGLGCELGVGGQSFDILIRLARSPGNRLRMSDLAAQTGLSPGGLTRSIDRLVGVGLAIREACPSDRRATYARLTPLGAERVGEALARHQAEVGALLEDVWCPEEVAALEHLLRRLRDRVHPDAALVSPPEAGEMEVSTDRH